MATERVTQKKKLFHCSSLQWNSGQDTSSCVTTTRSHGGVRNPNLTVFTHTTQAPALKKKSECIFTPLPKNARKNNKAMIICATHQLNITVTAAELGDSLCVFCFFSREAFPLQGRWGSVDNKSSPYNHCFMYPHVTRKGINKGY